MTPKPASELHSNRPPGERVSPNLPPFGYRGAVRERVLRGARLAAAALVIGVGARARAAGNPGPSPGGTGGPPAEKAAESGPRSVPGEPGPPESAPLIGGPSTCPHPDE